MVKAYLRYQQIACIGNVFNANSAAIFDHTGRLAISGALEAVQIWNIKQGLLVSSLVPARNEQPIAVTTLALHPTDRIVAAGYSDGSIRLWHMSSTECLVTYRGHKTGLVCLQFNDDGSRLASGSNDTDLIIWDVVGQCGLFSLRGHLGPVTAIVFIHGQRLVSSSKDTFIKVWDLESQHCVQTLTGHHHEVWSLDVNAARTLMVSGSTDPELRLWRIGDHIELIGTVQRQQSKSRVRSIRFHDELVGVQSTGKVLELYRIRNEAAMKKRIHSRVRRFKEKHGDDVDISEASNVTAADYLELIHTVATKDPQRSLAFASQSILVGLGNNSLQVYNVKDISKDADIPLAFSIDEAGHRSGVRCAALSRDDTMLVCLRDITFLNAFNIRHRSLLRTAPSRSGTCSARNVFERCPAATGCVAFSFRAINTPWLVPNPAIWNYIRSIALNF
jgi:U3 small nucleolar RNA-associated protein 12